MAKIRLSKRAIIQFSALTLILLFLLAQITNAETQVLSVSPEVLRNLEGRVLGHNALTKDASRGEYFVTDLLLLSKDRHQLLPNKEECSAKVGSIAPKIDLLRLCSKSHCQKEDHKRELSEIIALLTETRGCFWHKFSLIEPSAIGQALKFVTSYIESLENNDRKLVLESILELLPIILRSKDNELAINFINRAQSLITKSDATAPSVQNKLLIIALSMVLHQKTADRLNIKQAQSIVLPLFSEIRSKNTTKSEQIHFISNTLLLSEYTGVQEYREYAKEVLDMLLKSVNQLSAGESAGVLASLKRFNEQPLHITVVASKNDSVARDLFLYSQALYYPYLRLDWWDRDEGPMINPDVRYPVLKRPAAFVCIQHHCSLPLFTTSELSKKLDKILFDY
jgi:hypothetical protein